MPSSSLSLDPRVATMGLFFPPHHFSPPFYGWRQGEEGGREREGERRRYLQERRSGSGGTSCFSPGVWKDVRCFLLPQTPLQSGRGDKKLFGERWGKSSSRCCWGKATTKKGWMFAKKFTFPISVSMCVSSPSLPSPPRS